MYGRAIRFVTVQQSAVGLIRVYPSFFVSSVSTQSNYKNRNLIDEIRESASGMPPSRAADGVKVVNTSTTPSASDRREEEGETTSYVAEAAKQGVGKAMETGLNIGEMAKQTLDIVWDATKDTTDKVKEVVAGQEDKKYDVPPTDHFVDDLRKRADGYDLRRGRNGSGVNDN
ncbi:hypothetical protein HanIR_Chr15g0780431 [Helianthus annuus]|nr:hypothetical protein HanIR_Chr15g0780431 [Helianthus annuus]